MTPDSISSPLQDAYIGQGDQWSGFNGLRCESYWQHHCSHVQYPSDKLTPIGGEKQNKHDCFDNVLLSESSEKAKDAPTVDL